MGGERRGGKGEGKGRGRGKEVEGGEGKGRRYKVHTAIYVWAMIVQDER